MKKLIPFLLLSVSVAVLVVLSASPLAGQAAAPGKLVVFADMALYIKNGAPRNCFTMNRFKVGEGAGFRATVLDGGTGLPVGDAEVVVHITYGGKTTDIPMRWRGAGRGEPVPTLWTARWTVPADTPTGIVGLSITAKDKSGRTAEWKPFPHENGQLTIVNE